MLVRSAAAGSMGFVTVKEWPLSSEQKWLKIMTLHSLFSPKSDFDDWQPFSEMANGRFISSWSCTPFVFTSAVDCGTLTNPANGRVSYSGRTTFGQTANYSCNTGYNLVGGSTRTCQATGDWSDSAHTCQGMLLFKLESGNHSTKCCLKTQFMGLYRKIITCPWNTALIHGQCGYLQKCVYTLTITAIASRPNTHAVVTIKHFNLLSVKHYRIH